MPKHAGWNQFLDLFVRLFKLGIIGRVTVCVRLFKLVILDVLKSKFTQIGYDHNMTARKNVTMIQTSIQLSYVKYFVINTCVWCVSYGGCQICFFAESVR